MTESKGIRQKWKTQIFEEDEDPFKTTKKQSLLSQNLEIPRSASVKPEKADKDDPKK